MSDVRTAAVVMPIYGNDPHEVVFVHRATHLRAHPGQIAFPGGTVDPEDGDDRARTALRELEEELGVGPEAVRIVARLPEVSSVSGSYLITPFVGVLIPHTRLVIDPGETAAVWNVPLAAILEPGAVHQGIEIRGERRVLTDIFDHEGMHVWGATGRILRLFVDRWNDRGSELRRELDAALAV
jgi:8-oxo-dGTP pyrophosphatase MutT (NUDIX family)